MEAGIINIMNNYGYLGIILLIAIENLFPPIPSEVILTFGGFATTISNITVIGTIIASTVGSVLGAIILYYIGTILNEHRIESIVRGRIGRFLGLKANDIKKAVTWFNKKGTYAVFIGRFIPIIRSLVSIPAGMAKMSMGIFLFLTTIGSLIWNTVLILLGRIAGKSWGIIAEKIGGYSDFVIIVFALVFVLGILLSYFKRNKRVTVITMKKQWFIARFSTFYLKTLTL